MEECLIRGQITELLVMAELMKYGNVSVPYGNNCRYDCILEKNGVFRRIQVKTARTLDDNRFLVPFSNNKIGHNKNTRKPYTKEDVDYIATYYNSKLYVFPIGSRVNAITISFEYPSNGLKKKINLAEDYEADKILKEFLA